MLLSWWTNKIDGVDEGGWDAIYYETNSSWCGRELHKYFS